MLEIYTFVYFLNPIYIYSCISWILGPSVYVHIKTFFNFSYLVTKSSFNIEWYSHSFFFLSFFFLYKLQGKYVNERYSLGARNI